MADQVEISNTVSVTVVSSEPVTEQEKIKTSLLCLTCESIISDEDRKLTCGTKGCEKTACESCVKLMLRTLFSEAEMYNPLRCGKCSKFYDTCQIDRFLEDQKIYEQYISCVLPLFWLDDCLQTGEALARCPFCPYLEIHTTDSCSLDFLTCQNPSCGIRSCLICRHAIENDADETEHRHRCTDLQKYKKMIENAIEIGSTQRCPYCDLAGLKDDGCTHMYCRRCGTGWCYFCGMNEDDCPVDDNDEQSLVAHNRDWNEHQDRCPMLLISIHELDDRWPDNDEDCLEYFHRYKTLSELYKVLKDIGEDKLEELNEEFSLIDVTGYTLDEIKEQRYQTLINYPTGDEE